MNKSYIAYFSSVLRCTQDKEITGYLYKICLSSGSIKKKRTIPIDSHHPFWNKRGGNRGGRGVYIHDKKVYLATASQIIVYDLELNYLQDITHPYLAGLHEIIVDEEGIWCTSTIHDLIIKIDFNGKALKSWFLSESSYLMENLAIKKRKLNLSFNFKKDVFEREYERYCEEERTHVNGICLNGNMLYALLCRQSAIVSMDLNTNEETLVLQDPNLKSPHNVLILNDGIYVNNTLHQQVMHYGLQGNKITTYDTQLYNGALSAQFTDAGWQRGLAAINDTSLIVGTSPLTLFELNLQSGAIGNIIKIDSDVSHCVHGLFCMKDGEKNE